MPYRDEKREHSRTQATYDFYIEIDCDCEALLDAIGLDYKQCEDDDTQNVVALYLTREEFTDVVDSAMLSWKLDGRLPDEQDVGTLLLNDELGEYTTKVTIYTPSGDKICFS